MISLSALAVVSEVPKVDLPFVNSPLDAEKYAIKSSPLSEPIPTSITGILYTLDTFPFNSCLNSTYELQPFIVTLVISTLTNSPTPSLRIVSSLFSRSGVPFLNEYP